MQLVSDEHDSDNELTSLDRPFWNCTLVLVLLRRSSRMASSPPTSLSGRVSCISSDRSWMVERVSVLMTDIRSVMSLDAQVHRSTGYAFGSSRDPR